MSTMRQLLMTRRQALLMELGAIEDFLGLRRSVVPKRKRGSRELLAEVEQINLALGGNDRRCGAQKNGGLTHVKRD